MDRSYSGEAVRPQAYDSKEDVNGFFPSIIYIKTLTQTFNQTYYFLLFQNRIYAKSIDPTGDLREWTLFKKIGLPENRFQRGFVEAKRIVAISADDNELQAISDTGRIYQYVLSPGLMIQDYFWNDKMGWPETTALKLNPLVADFRSWAVSKRSDSVLWYEDRFGNQHHYGTMGIENSFFLCANGQDIRFTDTGLPSDFSHSILGPERGKVIAESLSASALTMFIITAAGEMYTRLADFDSLGSDPLFYLYTYRQEKSDLPGTDYRTNFTPWALPSEDWKKQPAIALSGEARITKRITILQNGRGNFARELRVAGTDSLGHNGYYYKSLQDTAWLFRSAPLALAESDFLNSALVAGGQAERGPTSDIAYSGKLWHRNAELQDIELTIPDFNLGEGSCHLRVTRGREHVVLVLHPVDAWTYVRRYDPGRDNTPKLFMLTLEIPEGAFDSVSSPFKTYLESLFLKFDRRVFAFTAEATTGYILIRQSSAWESDLAFFFTGDDGESGMNPDIIRKISIGTDELMRDSVSADLVVDGAVAPGFSERALLVEALNRNRDFKIRLQNAIELYRKYKFSAVVSDKTYSLFERFARVTRLNRLNFPKIYTATLHGSAVMQGNAENMVYTTNAKLWMYEKTLQVVDLRIKTYSDILSALNTGTAYPSFLTAYSESFNGYFAKSGLPLRIDGVWLPESEALNCRLVYEPVSDDFSSLVLLINNNPSRRYMVDFMNLPADVLAQGSVSVSKRAFVTAVNITQQEIPGAVREKELPVLRNAVGYPRIPGVESALRLSWNGSTLTIWRETPLEKKIVIFSGNILPQP